MDFCWGKGGLKLAQNGPSLGDTWQIWWSNKWESAKMVQKMKKYSIWKYQPSKIQGLKNYHKGAKFFKCAKIWQSADSKRTHYAFFAVRKFSESLKMSQNLPKGVFKNAKKKCQKVYKFVPSSTNRVVSSWRINSVTEYLSCGFSPCRRSSSFGNILRPVRVT